MEIHSMVERWDLQNYVFLYTHVILQKADDYYSVNVSQRPSQLANDAAALESLATASSSSSLTKIPPEHIWPLYQAGLQICSDHDRPDVYVKQPRLSGYNGSATLSSHLLQEAHICQTLMQHPHPNIARYLGCVVKNGRITGLCFDKYAETLSQRRRDHGQVDKDRCMRQIEQGIKHLHGLDLVHNDIHGDNVMFIDKVGEALVLIDFDSCALRGTPLPGKRGEVPRGVDTAMFENDELGLANLDKALDEDIY